LVSGLNTCARDPACPKRGKIFAASTDRSEHKATQKLDKLIAEDSGNMAHLEVARTA
jgi:hypothetical protein